MVSCVDTSKVQEEFAKGPLSPPFFVKGMDIFYRVLDLRYSSGLIGAHPKASNPNVSHLVFADDMMVFFDGSLPSLQAIVHLLSYFSTISGLTMNMSKTALFLACTSHVDKVLLSDTFGFTLGTLPVRYLGLSLLSGRLSKSDYAHLIERVKVRLHS